MSAWEAFGAAIVGAVVGGAITGFFTLRATKQEHRNTVALQQQKEKEIIGGLLQSDDVGSPISRPPARGRSEPRQRRWR
jgi:hypothetical protein